MSGFDGTAGMVALGAAALTAFATDLPPWLLAPVGIFVYGVVHTDNRISDRSSNHGERLNSINNRLNLLTNHHHNYESSDPNHLGIERTSVPRYRNIPPHHKSNALY